MPGKLTVIAIIVGLPPITQGFDRIQQHGSIIIVRGICSPSFALSNNSIQKIKAIPILE
jgi:hypothetical protein